MGSHKTKDQLERELNELKNIYKDKCQECDRLSTLLEGRNKDLSDTRAELQVKEACNKKLADQFYDYRTELVKVRKDLADAIEKRDSFKVELEGVRGALKRESELRVDAEKKRDEYKQEMVKWKNEAGQYYIWWKGACKENELLRNELNEVEKIQRKHNKLTLEDIDNALRHWEYTDNKLSHDLSMPLESLIQLLDEYDVNDFCKLRERLMYGPAACYNSLHTRRLEKENKDLKAVADDLEKQRKAAVSAYDAAARKNDELQNEVNKLYQRWTDTFNPEDELLGRKVLEWQEINVVLAKHNIESAEKLDARLSCSCPEEYMKVFNKYGIGSAKNLEQAMGKLNRISVAAIALKNNVPYLGSIADLVKELA